MSSQRGAVSRRSTGARAVKPTNAALNSDDEFWNQGAFEESEGDESFDEDALSDKGEDVIDSDFDDPEDNADSSAQADPMSRPAAASSPAKSKARTGHYVDPALKKTRPGRRRGTPAATETGDGHADRPVKRAKLHEEDTGEDALAPIVDRTSLRKSTKAARELADKVRKEREVDRNERRMMKREREKDKTPERLLTQDELLKESDETAVQNTADLQVLLRLEEERKRIPKKPVVEQGPTMTVISREGKTLIHFKDKDADARATLFPQAFTPETPTGVAEAPTEAEPVHEPPCPANVGATE